jgi:UDP:flavonoid glycosyltransferase YjiC (YdhE family)
VTPLGADQPENAARCAELGVGLVIEPGQHTPEAIRDAVRVALRDRSYRTNAERVQREIQHLPGPAHAVRLLTQLAAERRPLVTAA